MVMGRKPWGAEPACGLVGAPWPHRASVFSPVKWERIPSSAGSCQATASRLLWPLVPLLWVWLLCWLPLPEGDGLCGAGARDSSTLQTLITPNATPPSPSFCPSLLLLSPPHRPAGGGVAPGPLSRDLLWMSISWDVPPQAPPSPDLGQGAAALGPPEPGGSGQSRGAVPALVATGTECA